jgi:aromatic ring-cleaving dioxygenase
VKGQRGSGAAGQFRTKRLIAACLLLTGCFGPRQQLRDDSGSSPLAEGFELTLNNRHWLDINVFVQHDGESSRVTMVTASTSQSLILPVWLLGESKLVRIIAEPVGEHDSYTTELLRVDLGQSVEVNVESVLSRSNYSIQ